MSERWTYDEEGGCVLSEHGKLVCDLAWNRGEHQGQLIAAAPQMRGALEAFIAGIDRTADRECGVATVAMARAALAAAEGKGADSE